MAQSPYFSRRDKEIRKEWKRKIETGKYLKKQLRNILARKWGTSARNIRRILGEIENS